MLDPIQLPILMKAIDFVFDEGRKILEERRERRKRDDHSPEPKAYELAGEIQPFILKQAGVVKQDLLASKIDEIPWQNNEAEIQHLVRLLETYSNNYHIAREQYAKWGSELVPPIVVHRMTDAENSMLETIQRLEIILAKVYKKEALPIK